MSTVSETLENLLKSLTFGLRMIEKLYSCSQNILRGLLRWQTERKCGLLLKEILETRIPLFSARPIHARAVNRLCAGTS